VRGSVSADVAFRSSAAISFAVLKRSVGRFESALRQMSRFRLGFGLNLARPDEAQSWRSGTVAHVGCSSIKWMLAGQQFVHHHSQTEDVRTTIYPVPFASGLFWTHVFGRAGIARAFPNLCSGRRVRSQLDKPSPRCRGEFSGFRPDVLGLFRGHGAERRQWWHEGSPLRTRRVFDLGLFCERASIDIFGDIM